MKCKVGNRVRFLNDVGGGTISRIIDSKTVSVLNEDGFEIPVLDTEVIVIDSSTDIVIESRFPEIGKTGSGTKVDQNKAFNLPVEIIADTINKSNVLENLSIAAPNESKDFEGDIIGLLLAFVPKDQQNTIDSDQEVYLINDSSYRVLYTLGRWNKERNRVEPIAAGIMPPDSKELVKEYKKSELNSPLALNIQALFFKNISYIAQQPDFFDIELNPIKFYRLGSFVENDFFDEKAMVITIADTKKEEIIKTLTDSAIIESISQKDSKPKVESPKSEPELIEVDLHIHELVENHVGMQPGEMLEVQLARFALALETGLRSNTTKKMVFIHGLGNGKLKNEIIKALQRDYSKLRYQDASFKEYGFGATLVFLK